MGEERNLESEQRSAQEKSDPHFLADGGEMGALIRSHDWAATSLGPPSEWPLLLKTSVRLLLTSRHAMFIWWGPELIQFYNDEYRETLGPERHPAALGQPGRECWRDVWNLLGPEIEFVMQRRGAIWHEDREVPLVRKGSVQTTWWNYSLSPIEDETNVHGVIAICSDVTEEHTQRRLLKQSYRALLRSTDQAFCMLEPIRDNDGKVTDFCYLEVNTAFERHTGVQDPSGQRMRDIFPDEDPGWIEEMGLVTYSGKSWHVQREMKCLNKWFEYDIFPVGESGAYRVGMLFRDITKQKQNEDALQASRRELSEALRQATEQRALLNAILDAAPVALIVADENGALSHLNEESRRMWGRVLPMSRSVTEYSDWKGWFAPGSDREGQQLTAQEWPLARALRGEESLRELIEIQTFDDPPTRKCVLASAVPIRDDAGSIEGAVVALMDVSDQVRAEQELRQAHQRKDNFLAVLAHEMRNPLAPIAAAADVLRISFPENDKVQHTSAMIARQVKHLTSLLDDLLDLSRLGRGMIALEEAEIDVKHMVALAVEQAQPLIESQRHTLNVHCGADQMHIRADKRRLLQILANLLNNAAKYTQEQGLIEIFVEAELGLVRITVRDNGIGMTPEFAKQAFEMFSQADQHSRAGQSGLGVGLSLVKRLAEMQGGQVELNSDGLGKGTTVTVSFPRIKEATAARRPTILASNTKVARHLLIADDNTDAAEMLATLLRAIGHEVDVVRTAREVLDYAARNMPDAYLLNIGLPDQDGYQVARQLRSSTGENSPLLIAITGFGQPAEMRAAYEAGFDHYFVKPVPLEQLSELLTYGHVRAKRRA